MEKILKNTIQIFILAIILLFSGVNLVFAASLDITPSKTSVDIEEEFYVDVSIDTEGSYINGIEGNIKFNNEEVSVVRIEDGKSIINLWIEKPKEIDSNIKFSGIISNGFDGVIDPFNSKDKLPGLVLRIVFKGIKNSSSIISSAPLVVTLNDGLGTIIEVSESSSTINISKNKNPYVLRSSVDSSPELDIEITRDPSMYSNKYVLIFQAKDKEAGIAKVMIKEGRRNWAEAESPYLLKDQSRHSHISILATSYSGVSIVKNIDGIPYKSVSIFSVIILILVVLFVLFIVLKIYKYKYGK